MKQSAIEESFEQRIIQFQRPAQMIPASAQSHSGGGGLIVRAIGFPLFEQSGAKIAVQSRVVGIGFQRGFKLVNRAAESLLREVILSQRVKRCGGRPFSRLSTKQQFGILARPVINFIVFIAGRTSVGERRIAESGDARRKRSLFAIRLVERGPTVLIISRGPK